ncbi:histidine phosphatase family protein [Longispora sp. K20-0274]|uniref:histidine phosphatase family protein n=1 Tax=Longispora sp. K20-0274 TaxID=3088255 RepID=UPI00399B2159
MTGPIEIVAVRHGQSAANAAFEEADATGTEVEGLPDRDADVALSPAGRAQSAALGRWLAALRADRAPDVVYCSPYLRARQTWALAAGGRDERPVRVDERLRDREMGQLELLNAVTIARRFPEEARRRERLGDFYHRPLGGESLADVALRLRSFLADLDRAEPGRRVLLVTHDAVVLMLRYLTEGLDEAELRELMRAGTVRNAAVNRWEATTGRLRLVEFGRSDHLDG